MYPETGESAFHHGQEWFLEQGRPWAECCTKVGCKIWMGKEDLKFCRAMGAKL